MQMRRWVVALVGSLLLAACSSRAPNHAPVEDRGTGMGRPMPVAAEPVTPAPKQPPGFENAGKPGYYTVKPGDTLIRIGLENGQNWRDISRWNNLSNPNSLEVGQVLRVVPPVGVAAVSAAPAAAPVAAPAAAAAPQDAGVVARPVSSASATPLATATSASPRPVAPAAPVAGAAAATGGEDDIQLMWPVNGAVLAGFDEVKNKGLDIGGKAGEPVVAAADGRVVYAGAGLRGYGNLIILKHNNTYLTAYAHNQTLLVKEEQTVRGGQQIAEMGDSDADRVKLHFEVRRQGKPVDPTKYLPAR